MTSEDMEKPRQQHESQALIPAGILIGLGAGLLLGYAGPGVLIGLGCGLIAASLSLRPGRDRKRGIIYLTGPVRTGCPSCRDIHDPRRCRHCVDTT